MKVMVIFHLPDGGGLLYCQLADLAFVPSSRSTYPWKRKLYQVDRVLEVISRKPDGKRKSTSEQLLELLGAIKALSPNQHVDVTDLAKMTNIGDPEDDIVRKSPGGLILSAATELVKESDRLVVLKMALVGEIPEVDENSLLALLKGAQHLTAATAHPQSNAAD
jgi:hypothetical protein